MRADRKTHMTSTTNPVVRNKSFWAWKVFPRRVNEPMYLGRGEEMGKDKRNSSEVAAVQINKSNSEWIGE
jgi:hypothetical protein